jgi:hypothetical protein
MLGLAIQNGVHEAHPEPNDKHTRECLIHRAYGPLFGAGAGISTTADRLRNRPPRLGRSAVQTSSLLRQAVDSLGAERVLVAPSCSLLHVPHDLSAEAKLPVRLKSWLRFAEEKMAEIGLRE